MKSWVVSFCISFFASQAMASQLGFRCQVPSQNLQIEIQHGTRLSQMAKVMIISDQSQAGDQQVFSVFRHSNRLLSNEESLYIAKVDFTFPEVGSPQKAVGQLASLGQIKQVILDIDFVEETEGSEDVTEAIFSVELLSGEEVAADAVCEVIKESKK